MLASATLRAPVSRANRANLRPIIRSAQGELPKATAFFAPAAALACAAVQTFSPAFEGSSRFKVIRLLGRGGMGVVYEALDEREHTRVALKVLPLVNPERLLRFKREFRTVAEIHHPNLVRLGELVGDGERWFFTMELVHGVDVVSYVRGARTQFAESTVRATQVLAPGPPAEPASGVQLSDHEADPDEEARLRSTLGQLADALETLHQRGCVHRDVTPGNVMVTPAGRVVLLDFGLSSGAGWESTVMDGGTPHFMAPEQAAAEPVGPAADWYAFGVVMHELLTGALPFSGSSSLVLWSKQHRVPAPVRELCPAAPADLAALCDALLRTDPRARPSGPEVLAALPAARRSEESSPGHAYADESTHVIGRSDEWSALARALEQVRRKNRARVVVLRGESGVGKSMLARKFVEAELERGEALVFQGRCYERELLPFKAVDGVFDAMAHWLRHQTQLSAEEWLPRRAGVLAQVFPVLARVEALKRSPQPELTADRGEVRSWLFTAVRELFKNLSVHKPVVLLIDDLQWADDDSIALLTELLGAPGELSLLVLATFRTHPSSPTTADLPRVFAELVDEQHLVVRALTQAAACTLAQQWLSARDGGDPADASLVGSPPDAHATRVSLRAEQLARESGGHPLFLRELVRGAREHGPVLAELTLEEVFRTRARALTADSQRTLRVLAVAGLPLLRAVVRAAVGLDAEALPAVIHELRGARFAYLSGERGDERLVIAHDRMLRAILSELSEPALKAIHAQLGSALESSDDAFGAALHFRAAGEPVRAARHFARAGEMAASALAFADAIEHLQTALSDGDWSVPERCELLRRLSDALSNAGRGPAAAARYAEAADLAAASERIGLRRRAAEELLRAGYLDEGREVAREVLAEAGLKLARSPVSALLWERARIRLRGEQIVLRNDAAPEELARVDLCWSFSSGLILTDYLQGAYLQARGLSLALRSGDPYRVARSVATEGAYTAGIGASEERAWALLGRARQIAETLQHPQALGTVSLMEGIAHHVRGRFPQAIVALDAADEILRTRCTGAIWELDACRQFWLESTYYLGELRRFSDTVAVGLREATERGAIYSATNLRTGVTNAMWLLADQPERAHLESDEAMRRWSARGFHVQHWYDLLAQVQASLYEATPAAHALIEQRWQSLSRSQLLRISHLRVAALHLRGRAALVAATHQRADAREPFLRRALQCAAPLDKEPDSWCRALAACLRAGAHSLSTPSGDTASALLTLRRTLTEAALPVFEQALDVLREEPDQAAWQALRAQGVVRPDRWANMLIPGLQTR